MHCGEEKEEKEKEKFLVSTRFEGTLQLRVYSHNLHLRRKSKESSIARLQGFCTSCWPRINMRV
jgi:hypothetical protein